jgi:putative tryptophan/tyrosine transport system substrate-binding protein
MRRREFIAGLAGTAAIRPLPARAQQPERVRRIGILWPYAETDPDSQSRIGSLRRALQDLGWTEGRNLRFDTRWGASAEDRDRIRR